MAISIGSATVQHLIAQPRGYEETEIKYGMSARKWLVAGLVSPSEWLAVLAEYDDWRDQRIEDESSLTSQVVGTTINFSGTGPGGETWTNVPCWFLSAPTGEQAGAKIVLTVELVDAAQALEVLLKQEELSAEADAAGPDLGTITIGSAVITLTRPPDTYIDGPEIALTAGGVHYLSGPKVVQRLKNVEGTTNATGWAALRSWYEAAIVSTPVAGDWYPVSVPQAEAENKIVAGIATVQYNVAIQLAQVIA